MSLARELSRLDGRPYPAYRDLQGRWAVGDLELHIDRVQGDPFAAPSRVRLVVPLGVPDADRADPDRKLAAEDALLRQFAAGLRSERRGSGGSGRIDVYRPGPEVLERSALRLLPGGDIEVRFAVGLPARGRRILGRQAEALLCGDVPAASGRLVLDERYAAHLASVQRQRALRRALPKAGLVAFVEDGSVLPRRSGVDRRPMSGAVPFESPASLRVTLETALGPATGLGIPRGVTLITGGGFHGKSTLLHALERGHLDHVPGDGREGVVASPRGVKVRAEDGRSVNGIDISAFLDDLPGGRDTTAFVTQDASGSTSQAAAIVEAAASGADVLYVDEDTSATNLLVCDSRMRQLIEAEPITPFVARAQQLFETWGLSTVMVVGGVGDALAVADTVLGMRAFRAWDATSRARELAGEGPPVAGALPPLRVPVPGTLGDLGRVRARDRRAVRLGDGELDLTAVSGVLDAAQARTLGRCLAFLAEEGLIDGRRDLRRVLDAFDAILGDEGIEVVSAFAEPPGDLIRPRRHEIAAAWARLRLS